MKDYSQNNGNGPQTLAQRGLKSELESIACKIPSEKTGGIFDALLKVSNSFSLSDRNWRPIRNRQLWLIRVGRGKFEVRNDDGARKKDSSRSHITYLSTRIFFPRLVTRHRTSFTALFGMFPYPPLQSQKGFRRGQFETRMSG